MLKNKQVIIWFSFISLLTLIGVSAILIAQVPHVEARAAFNVATEAELAAAINTANGNGVADTITLTDDITLTGALPYITSEITLDGAGHYLDGAGSNPILEVNSPGDFTVQNVTIQNGAALAGGGILLYTGSLTVINCTFDNNTATYGGAIANYAGDTLTVTSSTFTNNTAIDPSYGGGAISSFGGTVTITGSTFTNNTAPSTNGGALDIEDFTLLSISDSTFTGNSSPTAGAAYIYSVSGAATIDGSVFTGNDADFFYAGAIYSVSTLAITNTTFDGNTSGLGGGAILNGYMLSIENSSFVNNSTTVDAGSGGGAILNYSWLEVTNSTFSGNTLTGTGTGGAIFDNAGTLVTLVYTTFSGNTAGGGGNALGDYNNSSSWYLGGVIIENGGAGNNCALSGAFGSGSDYNLSDDASCGLGAAGVGTDNASLTLNPISGSGPGEQTHMPTATSDAIGAVPNGTNLTIGYLTMACNGTQNDQLGYSRPISAGACTGGAVEWDAQPRLSINNAAVTEGNSGTVTAQFTITASTTSASNVTVRVDTANGTATIADSDYVAIVGQTATITSGNLTTTVNVTVNGDTAVEPNETFFVNLSNPTNASILDAQGVGTILNDDIDCSIPLTTQTRLDACIAWANGHAGADTLTLGSNITLISALTHTIDTEIILDGQNTYYVNGAGLYRVFEVTATGNFTVQNATIQNGSGSGGGIRSAGILTVTNSSFINNTASSNHGGAIYSNGSALTITGSTFTGNTAPYGGAIYHTSGALTVTSSSFTDNDSLANGGAIQSQGGTVHITGSTFTTNDAGGLGGAVHAENFTVFELSGDTFTGNTAQGGGAVYIYGDATATSIDDSAFSYNEATSNYGGALYNYSLLMLTNSTFDHNTAASNGGGAIVNAGTVFGGVHSTLDIDNCSFVSNSAASSDGQHGGGAIFTTTQLVIRNSTFSGNSLTGSDTGGAIYDNQNTGDTILIYTTFSDNTSASGGNALGAYDSVTHYRFAGVIIENGGAGNNCAGSTGNFVNSGYNFADDATCNFGTGNNAILVLGALTGTGNGQQVHIPQSGSANNGAIPNGTTVTIGGETLACNSTQDDQRGTTRPPSSGGPCTSGAVEFVSLPTLSINDVSVAEGNSGTTTAQFTITASKTWGTDITVQVDTANSTATAGSDYTALTAQTATITAGNLTTTVNVSIIGDTTVELNEQYYVNLSNPSGATIADAQGVGTITNDDSAVLSITGATVNPEGNSGSTNAVFSVTLTNAVDVGVAVNFATANFTATAGADYTSQSGVLNFSGASGQTLTISVPVLGDTLDEDDETFTVGLSGVTASGREAFISLSGSPATGTIIDDDNPPTLSINDMSVDEASGTASFTVSLSAVSGKNITVNASTMNGTATGGSDFTAISGQVVSIPAGSISAPLAVTILEDNIYEGTEDYTVVLSGPTNATLGDASGLGQITDNDPQPTINISDATPQNEGNSGTTAFSFTVTLTNPSSQSITVQVNTADGTATTADNDYQAISGQTLTFTPGQVSQPVTVNVNGDTTYESNETFTVNLSGASGASIGTGQGTGTILNDDAEPSPQFTWTGGPITPGCGNRQTQIPVLLENMRTDTEYILELVVYDGSGQYYMARRFAQTPRQPSGTFIDLLFDVNDFTPSGLTKVGFPISGTVTVETRLWDSTHTVDITDFIVYGYDCSTGGYSSIDTNP